MKYIINLKTKFIVTFIKFSLYIFMLPSIMFSQQSIIEGTVYSLKKPVSNANIIISGTKLGTTSNDTGFFRITGAPQGKVVIKFSHINFLPYTEELTIEENKTYKVKIELEAKTHKLQPVTVTAFKNDVINISSRIIDSTYIHSIPSLAEPDLFRSLTVLPGVIRSSDFTTKIFVRGGSPDQNMILIDNAELYNPNHIGGFVSAFDVDIIEDAELKTGGYSSSYGGRLSSVLKINTKDASNEKTTIKGGIGLLSSKLSMTGSHSKGSWIVSLRRTYLDILTKLMPKTPGIPYNFTDIISKISYNLSKNHIIRLHLLSTKDTFKYNKDLWKENYEEKYKGKYLTWGSLLFNVTQTSILKKDIIIENNFYISRNGLSSNQEKFDLKNSITDLSLKSIISYRVNKKHHFTGGLETKNIIFDYNWKNINNGSFHFFFNNSPDNFIYNNNLNQIDIFLEGNYSDIFSINYGIRLNRRKGYNETTWLPFLGLHYPVSSEMSLKGVYGHYYQNILTSREEEITDLADLFPDFYKLYFPLNRHKPEKAVHHIIEYDYNISSNINFNIQAYLKKYKNTYFLQGPEIHFERAVGESKGLEISSQISMNNFNVWFNYALSRCTFKDFISRYDKTHVFNIFGSINLSRKSSLGFKWNIASSFPYTSIIGKYPFIHHYRYDNILSDFYVQNEFTIKPQYGDINSARYPVYHRLDLSFKRYFKSKNFKFTLNIQILNIYNRKNFLAHYNQRTLINNEITFEKESIGYFPILPTIGFLFERK